MNRDKRKRIAANVDDDITTFQSTSKKSKCNEVIEKPSTSSNNENDDSFDSLIFDGSDVEDTSTLTTIVTDTNASNALKINVATDQKRKKKHIWTETEYDSLDQVEEFLDSEGFVLFDDKELKMGQKFYFRCSRIPKDRKRDEWCAPQYIIFLPSDSNKIILQFNGMEHNHNALLSTYKLRPISNEMKDFLVDLFDSGVTKSCAIKKILQKARNNEKIFVDEPDPTPRQINYLLAKFRKDGNKAVVNVGDLIQWCEEREAFPSDPDEAFVLGHKCSTEENQSFIFCMSTPQLLNILSDAPVVSIDATYKLNWMEYPLIVFGVVDNMKRFHPMVYGCTSHERSQDYTFFFEKVKESIALNLKKRI